MRATIATFVLTLPAAGLSGLATAVAAVACDLSLVLGFFVGAGLACAAVAAGARAGYQQGKSINVG